MSWDLYLDLTTGVLRNRLGITRPAELARAEAELTALRLAELHRAPRPGGYDLAHLRAVHHHLFQDVYDWAGQLRTVSIGKGGHVFCYPEDIVAEGERAFTALAARGHLRGLPRAPFLTELARLLADINALHPFREGNGRTQRAFLTQLAADAGHTLRWAGMNPEDNRAASRAALDGDLKPLREMLDGLLLRSPVPPPRDPG